MKNVQVMTSHNHKVILLTPTCITMASVLKVYVCFLLQIVHSHTLYSKTVHLQLLRISNYTKCCWKNTHTVISVGLMHL